MELILIYKDNRSFQTVAHVREKRSIASPKQVPHSAADPSPGVGPSGGLVDGTDPGVQAEWDGTAVNPASSSGHAEPPAGGRLYDRRQNRHSSGKRTLAKNDHTRKEDALFWRMWLSNRCVLLTDACF
jgi:hypothetical protein